MLYLSCKYTLVPVISLVETLHFLVSLNVSDESLQSLDSSAYDNINFCFRRMRVFPDQSSSWIVLQGKADRGANVKNQWEVMCLLQTTSQVCGATPEWVFRDFFFLSRPFVCMISAGRKTPICSRLLSILSQLCAIKTAECQRAARRGSEETEESN